LEENASLGIDEARRGELKWEGSKGKKGVRRIVIKERKVYYVMGRRRRNSLVESC